MSAALLVSAGWGASNGRECRNGQGLIVGPCSPPSFRRFVIPAKAGIQRSPRTGARRRAVPLHRHSGESRNPEVTPDMGSSSGHAPHRHSDGSRNPEVTPDVGSSSGRAPPSSFRRKPESRGRTGRGIVAGLCPPSSFRRKPESRGHPGRGLIVGPCPSIVIPAEAGIQRSPGQGTLIGPCPSIVIPAEAGIQRSPRTGDSHRAVPHVPFLQVTAEESDAPRIRPQEDGSRRNEFVCARRCFSADKMAVEFLEGRVEQPFRRTFHLILPVGAGLFRPRVPLPPLRPRRDVSHEDYISRQRLRDPECQGRRLSNDLREGRIPFRGPRRETCLSENFGPGSSACTGEFPARTCSVDLHSSVVFSFP